MAPFEKKLNDEFKEFMVETKYNKTPFGFCGFCKTDAEWGGFSNMHPGFPLVISEMRIGSTEHLYQALKFEDPKIQKRVLDERRPMEAKRTALLHKDEVRPDWLDVNLYIMNWVLTCKAAQHPSFKEMLVSTGTTPIVELNFRRQPDIWSARPVYAGNSEHTGCNVLGKLLMKLRDGINNGTEPKTQSLKWLLTGKGYKGKGFVLTDIEI